MKDEVGLGLVKMSVITQLVLKRRTEVAITTDYLLALNSIMKMTKFILHTVFHIRIENSKILSGNHALKRKKIESEKLNFVNL